MKLQREVAASPEAGGELPIVNLRQKSRIDQDSRTAIADFFSLSVGSQGSAFTVGAAAATAAGAVAASTRRKTRASRAGPWDGQAAAGGRPTSPNPSVLRSLPEPKWDLARRSWASTWAPPTPQWRPWRTLNLKAHEVTEAVLPRGRRTHHHPQRGGRTDHAQRCGLFQER